MNHLKSEGNHQPCASVPYTHIPVYQQSSYNHCFGFFQGGLIKNLPSVAMGGTQTPQPLSHTFQYYTEALNCTQHCCVPPLPDSSARPSVFPTVPQAFSGAAGDLTPCQLRNPSSSLPQGVAGASAHSSHKPAEDALQKRELRLMKNREAARECRRKKKEYVKCLENRVAVLENQNKTLIEELRALKDIYRHKVEEASRESRKTRKYMDDLETHIALLEQENQKLRAQLLHLYSTN